MTRRFTWPLLLCVPAIAIALVVSVRTHLAHVQQVSEFAMQGSPAPAVDPNSPTGYVHGQRHFIGVHERGETYRWIAATQEVATNGLFGAKIYAGDTVPTGRPSLMPRLYTGWLALVSWCLHLATAESIALSAERTALWEPLISHVLVLTAAAVFMGRRYGMAAAAAAALAFAFFPPLAGQFIPGVLTARTWALFFAAYTIALSLPPSVAERRNLTFSKRSALAASVALWLDPAFGFSAIVISAVVGTATHLSDKVLLPCLKWSLIGCGLTITAWLVDGAPWSPSAGELRYVHPYYGFAWLGIGLVLDGLQQLTSTRKTRRGSIEIITGAVLIAPLGYVQIMHAYAGWLYSSVWMRRLTSLDETIVYKSAREWLALASAAEIIAVSAPVIMAGILLVLMLRKKGAEGNASAQPSLMPAVVLLTTLVVFTFFRLRWGMIASLVALPLAWHLACRGQRNFKVIVAALAVVFLLGLIAWRNSLPVSFKRPSVPFEPTAADLDALIHRRFAHWLASRTPSQNVAALAPPELSDSLVFHGGCRVLMSTAWESYPGHLAVNRILSALESSEAEALIERHKLTHVILPSWDKVLPLFVQKPAVDGKDTLFDRLNRWVHPPFLRPVPYQLPPNPIFAGEKLAVFMVTPPQDDALSLSRLAEYFVEMNRTEPAELAAKALAASFPDDPNAAVARSLVLAHKRDQAGFERELSRLASDVEAGHAPSEWDRRVQRAIVLALGRREELARQETKACLDEATEESLAELTSLQAYRLGVLARKFRLTFSDPKLAEQLNGLGAEYEQARPSASGR